MKWMIQIMAPGTWIKRDMYNPITGKLFFNNKITDLLSDDFKSEKKKLYQKYMYFRNIIEI